MKERKTEYPILFSTPMVQAILDVRKTMTRRMKNLKHINENPDHWYIGETWISLDGNKTIHKIFANSINGGIEIVKNPFGNPGDKLWVRETWAYKGNTKLIAYKADADKEVLFLMGKWKPSIHMPKSAARIWLEITDVRVERLQDISEDDAKSEGIEFLDREDPYTLGYKLYGNHSHSDILGRKAVTGTAIESFQSLWESINGPDSWNANPWVWVIEFKRIDHGK